MKAALITGLTQILLRTAQCGHNHRTILGNVAELRVDGETNTIFITERKAFTPEIARELPALLSGLPCTYFRTSVGVWVVTPTKGQTPNEAVAFAIEFGEAWVMALGYQKPSQFAMVLFQQLDQVQNENPQIHRQFLDLSDSDRVKQVNALRTMINIAGNGTYK